MIRRRSAGSVTQLAGLILGLSLAWPLTVLSVWGVTRGDRPVIKVRWVSELTVDERLRAERDLDLVVAGPPESHTWSYFALDNDREALRAVVSHPAVEDTSGIDRQQLVLADSSSARYWAIHSWPILGNPYLLFLSLGGALVGIGLFAVAAAGAGGRLWESSGRRQDRVRWQHVALTLLVVLAVLLLWIRNDGLSRGTSFRYDTAALIAKTQLLLDTPRDYTGYVILRRVPEELSADEVRAWRAELSRASGYEDDQIFQTDDKGLVDFARWSYQLFGMNNLSFLEFWFLVLLLGIAVYVVDLHSDMPSLLLLLLFVLALYATAFAIPLTDQLDNLNDPRFYGSLSTVPLLHLLIATLRGNRSIRTLCCLMCQVFIVVIVYHARSSTSWQVLCVLSVAGALVIRDLASAWREREGRRLARTVLARSLPVVMLLAGLFALSLYTRVAYHPSYFGPVQSARHIVWHNVFMGFAVHPDLSQRYGIPTLSDIAVEEAAQRYILASGDRLRWERVFTDPDDGSSRVNWSVYDEVVREMVFDAAWRFPLETVTTFAFYKPRLFVRQFLWAMGVLPTSQDDLFLHDHGLASDADREGRDLYYRWFRWEIVAILVLGLALARTGGAVPPASLVFVAAPVTLLSLAPAFAAYPVIHVMGDAFVTVGVLVYAVTTWLALAWMARRPAWLPWRP